MPTILYIRGWRLFFYANEGKEPIHVHCEKEGKYWLDRENFNATEAFSHAMGPRDHREVKRLIFNTLKISKKRGIHFRRRKNEKISRRLQYPV